MPPKLKHTLGLIATVAFVAFVWVVPAIPLEGKLAAMAAAMSALLTNPRAVWILENIFDADINLDGVKGGEPPAPAAESAEPIETDLRDRMDT